MSGKQEKRRRAAEKEEFRNRLDCWRRSEPPRIFFISHWLWARMKPVYHGYRGAEQEVWG